MTLQDWWALLTKDPEDWNTRLAFADWLNDRGELELEQGQRWQVKHQKHPCLCRDGEWTWFMTLGIRDEYDDLARPLFARLKSSRNQDPAWRDYETMAQAEQDLAQALEPGD